MPIRPELLEILVCPVCKSDLELLPGDKGLRCKQENRVFPIRDGIPVMLVEESTIEPK